MSNTIAGILKSYQDFFINKMTEDKYEMATAPPLGEQGETAPGRKMPLVAIDSLPHVNFSNYNIEGHYTQAPYLLVGYEEANTGANETTVDVILQMCAYSEESYSDDEQMPDNLALLDCLNFQNYIEQALIQKNEIAGTTIELPIRSGTYNQKEKTYPYSFGYVSFTITKTKSEKVFSYE